MYPVVCQAVISASIETPASCYTFRHSITAQLLEARRDIRMIQELLGRGDVSTTMIYTHVVKCGALVVKSPLDRL